MPQKPAAIELYRVERTFNYSRQIRQPVRGVVNVIRKEGEEKNQQRETLLKVNSDVMQSHICQFLILYLWKLMNVVC